MDQISPNARNQEGEPSWSMPSGSTVCPSTVGHVPLLKSSLCSSSSDGGSKNWVTFFVMIEKWVGVPFLSVRPLARRYHSSLRVPNRIEHGVPLGMI